jgi:Xaa-Pro aminopeptidase
MQNIFLEHQNYLQKLMTEKQISFVLVYSNADNNASLRYLTNFYPLFDDALYIQSSAGEQKMLIKFPWELGRASVVIGKSNVIVSRFFEEGLENILGSYKKEKRIGIIGFNLLTYSLGKYLIEKWKDSLIDLDKDFNMFRLVKSEYELKLIEKAVQITEIALQKSFKIAKQHMTEKEFAAYLEFEIKSQGDALAFETIAASGENSLEIVSLPTNRRFQFGDTVIVDTGARYEGYCSDITRTMVVGNPSKQLMEVHRILNSILDKIIEKIKPGMVAKDIHQIAQELYTQEGLGEVKSRIGHGIGLDTSLEPLDLQYDDIILKPGMTFCIEPGYYNDPPGGIRIEDDVVVTGTGCELISHISRELVII